MTSDSTLTLFIPDLFGFQSTLSKLSKDELSQLPEIKLPILEKWLSRGIREESNHQYDFIFTEFGLTVENSNDKHHAALSLLAENISGFDINSKSYWLRADPVNIQPDRDTAILSAYEELALTQEEANKLVEQINSHFIEEPWHLYAFAPHRWYLQLEKTACLKTYPVKKVLGEDVNQFMPAGKDENYWFNITNEIQMLLHGSNVNFERESRNEWTANSIWLWGSGYLPEIGLKSSHDKIITNNILYSGIGRHCGCDVLSLDESFSSHIKQDNNFVILDMLSEHLHRRDLYTFVQELNAIDENFLKYCNECLEGGIIGKIKLITNDGEMISVTRKQLHHWWKRIKSFSGLKNA